MPELTDITTCICRMPQVLRRQALELAITLHTPGMAGRIAAAGLPAALSAVLTTASASYVWLCTPVAEITVLDEHGRPVRTIHGGGEPLMAQMTTTQRLIIRANPLDRAKFPMADDPSTAADDVRFAVVGDPDVVTLNVQPDGRECHVDFGHVKLGSAVVEVAYDTPNGPQVFTLAVDVKNSEADILDVEVSEPVEVDQSGPVPSPGPETPGV